MAQFTLHSAKLEGSLLMIISEDEARMLAELASYGSEPIKKIIKHVWYKSADGFIDSIRLNVGPILKKLEDARSIVQGHAKLDDPRKTQARERSLAEQLIKYARHSTECAHRANTEAECDCGFQHILSNAKAILS